MPSLPKLDKKIQKGRGKAAKKAGGQTYMIRRLDSKTNVSVSANRPVLTHYYAKLKRTSSKELIENQTFELLTFVALCDNRRLNLLDQAYEFRYKAMPQGVYIVAQMRPPKPTIWVRAESNVTITRPRGTAGDPSQQPSSMNVPIVSPGWSGTAMQDEEVLTLTNGHYQFSSEPGATAATVACGLSPNARMRDGNALDVPTEQYREEFLIYLPILDGELLNELDNVNFGLSDSYQIGKIYTSDLTGLAGYILKVEKRGIG